MANWLIAGLFSASETLIGIIQLRARHVRLQRASLGRPTSKGLVRREKRPAACHGRATQRTAIQLVLAAEVVELPRGARPRARTSDINCTACYIGTLNPVPHGFRVPVRSTHEDETFEAAGRIVHVCDVSAPRHLSRGLAQDVSVEILWAQTTRCSG
jgi:hypothetical protein